jgi:HEAT repeat protein
MMRNIKAVAIVIVLCGVVLGQTKNSKMPVRKLAIQVLGQTGDERAVAFFRELLSKE